MVIENSVIKEYIPKEKRIELKLFTTKNITKEVTSILTHFMIPVLEVPRN